MDSFFIESLDLREHPIKQSIKRMRAEYYKALSYIVNTVINKTEDKTTCVHPTQCVVSVLKTVMIKRYATERLKMYDSQILIAPVDGIADKNKINLASVTSWLKKPWRKKYRLILVCDVALILLNKELLRRAVDIFLEYFSQKQMAEIEEVITELFNERAVSENHLYLASLIDQYRLNTEFSHTKERRIIVTANMSAGKSTLINALVGKTVARTSQEACTGNVCYIFNKPFDDGNIHLETNDFTFEASQNDLHNYEWKEPICMASHFAKCVEQSQRLCIIDTPGVDSALHKEHRSLTHKALLNEQYDIVLSVVCPTKLGTDAEKKHLQWLYKNIPNYKIFFVLNKLDDYRDYSDSIDESIEELKRDLLKIGFENPTICPLSAYLAYLLKLKMTGQILTADEEDEYSYMAKKFKRSSYDLSRYYENAQCKEEDSDEIMLCKQVGLYGLEQILYGGVENEKGIHKI